MLYRSLLLLAGIFLWHASSLAQSGPASEDAATGGAAPKSSQASQASQTGQPSQAGAAGERIDFDRDIKGLLSDRCFTCHGPDAAQRSTSLRLDSRDGLYSKIEGEFGDQTVVAGDAMASELYRRIATDDDSLRMPPADSHLKLSADEIALIGRWIDQGAPWNAHWSFEAIVRPPVPPPVACDDPSFAPANPIDRFIDARLEQSGMRRQRPASPHQLVRRLYYDLTGLPPQPDEIDAALRQWNEHSYERLVDRLLSSPAMGEHLAASWLDAARYSDTYGYQVDRERRVWPWRDWVLDAINRNLPYDQFLTEQIAGDLLPGASDSQILATTFNRLHPQKVEGGSTPEEFRIEYVADRTQTFASAVLGLTLECARCHDHKYDPLSQREYYQLSAFFDNIDEAGLYSFFTNSVPTPAMMLLSDQQKQQIAAQKQQIADLQAELNRTLQQRWNQVAQDRETQPWLRKLVGDVAAIDGQIKHLDFENLDEKLARSGPMGKALGLSGDDEYKLDVGNFRRFDPFSIACWMHSPEAFDRAVVYHRSRAWTDAASRGYELLIVDGRLQFSLIHFWPGNAISVRTREPIHVNQWQHVTVTYDGSGTAGGIQILVDGHAAETEVVRDHLTKNITGGGNDHIILGARFRDRGFKGGMLDEFRVFNRQLARLEVAALALAQSSTQLKNSQLTNSQPATAQPTPPGEGQAIPEADSESASGQSIDVERLSAQPDDCFELFALRGDEAFTQARAEIRKAREKLAAIQDAAQEIMVMRELPTRRPTFVLSRGVYDAPTDPVQPEVPESLGALPAASPRDRLALARWVTDPANPLTARVAINRHWQFIFGNALVRTPEDFGTQGMRPTHRELLDWLASELIESQWDIKRMLKLMVMSQTYRQSSFCTPEQRQRDPENQWLSRAPSFRMSAEMLRDGILASSGLLDRTIGGPSVSPYELAVSFKPRNPDQGSGLYRRSIYTFWQRTGPPPAMMVLDASKRDVCQLRRERTSSPLQSFVLMNSPQFVEAAKMLALRVLTDDCANDPNPASVRDRRIDAMMKSLVGRPAAPGEKQAVAELLESQIQKFTADPKASQSLLKTGQLRIASDVAPEQWAAWTVVASTLMNFDLSVMRR